MMSPDERWESAQHRLAYCREELAKLAVEPESPDFWDKCYSAKIDLPLIVNTAAVGGFAINPGETFFVKEIQPVFQVTGVLLEDGTTDATITIPEALRPVMYDYTWFAKDTGSNGNWSDLPAPSSVLRGGNLRGLKFIKGHRRVRGGSRVDFTINPLTFDQTNASTYAALQTITGLSLTIICKGVSVRDGVLP